MKLRAITMNTFSGLVRNKIIILFSVGCVCILLLMLSSLLVIRNLRNVQNAEQMQAAVLPMIGSMMAMVSGFGSLLAAWSAADALSSEMRSGTILAVMARPVRRWEFLLGKYLGVQLLMLVFVLIMVGLNYLLAWIGGAHIQSAPWELIVYPMVRYAMFSAVGLALVTLMHPILAFCGVLFMSIAAQLVSPGAHTTFLPEWLKTGLFYFLPSTNLLSEMRFLTITRATLQAATWSEHAVALAYGLDYALVCFLIASWIFHSRSLSRD
ncbi:MAG: ABC transporter permease subunit [Bryobacteraceae bacterium]|jgi:ABC-type transport system involved in multi-copper enzyme maturation permease subunit